MSLLCRIVSSWNRTKQLTFIVSWRNVGPLIFLCTHRTVGCDCKGMLLNCITPGRSSQHSCQPFLIPEMHTCSAVNVVLKMLPLFCRLFFYVALLIWVIFQWQYVLVWPLNPWGHNPNVSTAHEGPHYKEPQQTFGQLGPKTLTSCGSALTHRSQWQVSNTNT